MPDSSVGLSGRWRVTVLVNEHGSMVADRGPGVREMDVMPVAEHEAEVERLIRERDEAYEDARRSLDRVNRLVSADPTFESHTSEEAREHNARVDRYERGW